MISFFGFEIMFFKILEMIISIFLSFGEKSQEQDVRWEPANAGKLEKEREQANQE